MFSPTEVKVQGSMTEFRSMELLGFIEHKTDTHWYYATRTLDDKGCSTELHVTPAFGSYTEIFYIDEEQWYLNELKVNKHTRHSSIELHEKNKEFHRSRAETHKYIVFFMGPDDGDKIMRFQDKEEALLFLSAADDFADLCREPGMFTY